jgi:hypothetical protein
MAKPSNVPPSKHGPSHSNVHPDKNEKKAIEEARQRHRRKLRPR